MTVDFAAFSARIRRLALGLLGSSAVRRALLSSVFGVLACSPADPPLPPATTAGPARADAGAPLTGGSAEGDLEWQVATRSPTLSTNEGLARALGELCARGDAALDRAATRLMRRLDDSRPLEPAELGFELRAAGSPHVWPRSWSYAGPALDPADTLERAKRWLGGFGDGGTRTCGAAHTKGPKHESVSLVVVDAFADLESVPSRARAGQWLDVTAKLLVPAQDAKVIVLGPHGAPRTLPTSLSSGVVRARFAPNSPGSWLVQVLADVDRGPRPVLEALVHADQKPPAAFHLSKAPGEEAAGSGSDAVAQLYAMVNAARRSEGAKELVRNTELEKAAATHAAMMRDTKKLGHDVGKGTVKARLEALGLEPAAFGENVARAGSAERAHRAIWASPSHRGNLLERSYDSVGIAAVESPEGVWVTEVFARLR